MFGATNDVVSMYLSSNEINEVGQWRVGTDSNKTDNPYFSPPKVCVVDKDLSPIKGIATASQKIGVVIEGEIEKLHQSLTIGFAVYTSVGDLLVWSLHTDSEKNKWPQLKVGYNKIVGFALIGSRSGDSRLRSSRSCTMVHHRLACNCQYSGCIYIVEQYTTHAYRRRVKHHK